MRPTLSRGLPFSNVGLISDFESTWRDHFATYMPDSATETVIIINYVFIQEYQIIIGMMQTLLSSLMEAIRGSSMPQQAVSYYKSVIAHCNQACCSVIQLNVRNAIID